MTSPDDACLPPQILACLGSSSTVARGQAFDWIAELQSRPRNSRVIFRRVGAGGDLAYNALRRLPDLIAQRADKLLVWIGTNDVLAFVSPKARRVFSVTKSLPKRPTPEWFRENLLAISRRLRSETTAVIALCSLVPIGEDLASADPFQADLNRYIKEYSVIIAEVARQSGCRYVPLYEAVAAQIRLMPGKAFSDFRFLPLYRDAIRALVFREEPDAIARLNGWRLHSDGLHLNGRSGSIVADRIQDFLDW